MGRPLTIRVSTTSSNIEFTTSSFVIESLPPQWAGCAHLIVAFEPTVFFVRKPACLIDFPTQTADADQQRASVLLIVNTGRVNADEFCEKLWGEALRFLVLPYDEQPGFIHGGSLRRTHAKTP